MDLDNNLNTNKIKKFLQEKGVDIEALPNNLMTTLIDEMLKVMDGGGTEVEGAIDITENGTYDVSTFAEAVVNVEGGSENRLKKLFDTTKSSAYMFHNRYYTGTVTSPNYSSSVNVEGVFNENDTENVEDASYMFSKVHMKNLTTLRFPNLKIANNMFELSYFTNTGLQQGERLQDIVNTIDFSKITHANYMFSLCGKNKTFTLPTTNFSSLIEGKYMFGGGTSGNYPQISNTTEFNFPVATNLSCLFIYNDMFTQEKLIINIGTEEQTSDCNLSSMFNGVKMFNCSLKEVEINKLGSGKVNLSNFFDYGSIEKIIFTNPIVASNIAYFSRYNRVLVSIEGIIDLRHSISNSMDLGYLFDGCASLESFTFKNIGKYFVIGSGTSWGHLLTLETLLNTIQELVDTGSTKALVMGSANLDKLANTYVKLTGEAEEEEGITKLPFEVCESTDEGALHIINEYASLKNWTIR